MTMIFDDAFIDIPYNEKPTFIREYLHSVGDKTSVAFGANLDEHWFEWLWVLFISDGTKTHMERRRFFYLPQTARFGDVSPSEHLIWVHMFRKAMSEREPEFSNHFQCDLPQNFIHCVYAVLDRIHAWSAISKPSQVVEYMGSQRIHIIAKPHDKDVLSFSTSTGFVYSDGTKGDVLVDKLLRFLQREPRALRRSSLLYQLTSLLNHFCSASK